MAKQPHGNTKPWVIHVGHRQAAVQTGTNDISIIQQGQAAPQAKHKTASRVFQTTPSQPTGKGSGMGRALTTPKCDTRSRARSSSTFSDTSS